MRITFSNRASPIDLCLNLQTFDQFVAFIVRISKEERLVHVFFTSSDSFFCEWLQTKGYLQ